MALNGRCLKKVDLGNIVEFDLLRDKHRVRRTWDLLFVRYWRGTMALLVVASAVAGGFLAYYQLLEADRVDARIAGVVATVSGLLTAGFAIGRGAEQRAYNAKLLRRQKALDMLSGWNSQTAAARANFERRFEGVYDNCARLKPEQVRELYPSGTGSSAARIGDGESSTGKSTERHVRDDVIQLLNYFEYISVAYLQGGVDRNTVLRSFAGTMVRYYCILGEFMLAEVRTSGRNPWVPYTEFVHHVLRVCGSRPGLAQEIGIDGCIDKVQGIFRCGGSRPNCESRCRGFRLVREHDDRATLEREDDQVSPLLEVANRVAELRLKGDVEGAVGALAELQTRSSKLAGDWGPWLESVRQVPELAESNAKEPAEIRGDQQSRTSAG